MASNHGYHVTATVILALALGAIARHAGAQSVSLIGSESNGCHEDPFGDRTWFYADDAEKKVTASGYLKTTYVTDDDYDFHTHLYPSSESQRFLTDKANSVNEGFASLSVEAATKPLDFGSYDKGSKDPGPFGKLAVPLLDGVNVVVRGEWVVDQHDIDLGDRLQNKPLRRHAEIHPFYSIRASAERDPLNAANSILFVVQDYNNCRNFLSTTGAVHETAVVQIPTQHDTFLITGAGGGAWQLSKLGFARESSVLDSYQSEVPHSLYNATYSVFPNSPQLIVDVTLPATYGTTYTTPIHPGYLAQFHSDSVDGYSDQVAYQPIAVASGKKAIHVSVNAKVTLSNASAPLQTASWSVVNGGGGIESSITQHQPTSAQYSFEGNYSPSEKKFNTQWVLGFVATDQPDGAAPPAAYFGWGWSRTIYARQRTYSIVPSHLTLQAVGPNHNEFPACESSVYLHAYEHLIPQIALSSSLTWSAEKNVPGQISHGLPSRPRAIPYPIRVNPDDDHLATVQLSGQNSILVSVAGVTELGEQMKTTIEVNPSCGGVVFAGELVHETSDCVACGPQFRLLDIWMGAAALKRLSTGTEHSEETQFRSEGLELLNTVSESEGWGMKLSGSAAEEAAAFLAFTQGALLSIPQRTAMVRLANRGANVRTTSPLTTAQKAAIMRSILVRSQTVEVNGRRLALSSLASRPR